MDTVRHLQAGRGETFENVSGALSPVRTLTDGGSVLRGGKSRRGGCPTLVFDATGCGRLEQIAPLGRGSMEHVKGFSLLSVRRGHATGKRAGSC